MNRNERPARAAPGAGVAPLLALAEGHRSKGRLREADAACARLLAQAPFEVRALHMRGWIAAQQDRPHDALTHFTRAVSVAPNAAALHDGLAGAYRALGQAGLAERHYRRAAELHPSAMTLLNLGNALMGVRNPVEAAAIYRSALRHDGRMAEAYHGIGTALAATGAPEAADAFARAVALQPRLAAAHEGLIDRCIAAEAWETGLQAACEALRHADTLLLRVQFVDCARVARLTGEAPGLRDALDRALVQRWTRPQDLAGVICDLIALRVPFNSRDALLGRLLELAVLTHHAAERALTDERRILLGAAMSGDIMAPETLAFACRLARQCFINEYAWACSVEESRDAEALGEIVLRALDDGLPPSETMLAALAMYRPLDRLNRPEPLLSYRWPDPLVALLTQQVAEPAEERRLAATIARATTIEDAVSRAVACQYEANPYPRWVKSADAMEPIALDDWLRGRFPTAPVTARAGSAVLDVLVAGCGTGLAAIETVRGFAGARVLAIDLSLASLAYAARMTAALGASGISYVQADLIEADSLGRSFDMISVGGVLHHLADPWAGWRSLLALLRPGGVMNVLLYTVRGRDDVRRARAWIAQRSYNDSEAGIRACRQELAALPDDWAMRLAASPDFFSMSGCRDLLFHVHEQAVTLPEVVGFLAEESLALIGVEVPASIQAAFDASQAPGSQRDLRRWDVFESAHPRCFAGMLNLWIRKPELKV
ncbi:methyltransferase [Lichenicoccus sp.]|uniref:methyltransferase n=1 Tax=Lichenicoccus sp. TaxID=2781899 RepID=UPI003D0DCEBC